MPKQISTFIAVDALAKDLEKYRKRAIELGATDAKIITSQQVIIDERVRAKCAYPKCDSWGTNAHCPPHSMEAEQTRKLVNRFNYVILFQQKIPSDVLLGEFGTELAKTRLAAYRVRSEIISKIEGEAFYDGYYFAMGFGGANCRFLYCPDKDCQALQGKGCRAPLKARSSMESVGMDVYQMAVQAGWDIYPVGKHACDLPHGTIVGIVLIY